MTSSGDFISKSSVLVTAVLATCIATGALAEHPRPVQKAVDHLADELGVLAVDVQVVAVEQVTWPDSSLGLPQPGEAYLTVLTPGYRVQLSVAGEQFVYHTDKQDRDQFRQAFRVDLRCASRCFPFLHRGFGQRPGIGRGRFGPFSAGPSNCSDARRENSARFWVLNKRFARQLTNPSTYKEDHLMRFFPNARLLAAVCLRIHRMRQVLGDRAD